MNIINLRNVGSYEIPDSYRGILRISPNNLIDDPTELLKDTSTEVYLSDSTGNQLPLSFVPKIYSTYLDGRNGLVELVNHSVKVNKLFVSNELNIKQTLYITLGNDLENTPPIIFSTGSNAVGYPYESPDDDKYFNFNNALGFDKTQSWDRNLMLISPEHDVYKDNTQWLSINGQYLYNHVKYDNVYHKVPMLKKRDYTLGARVKDKYYISKANNNIHNISDLTYQNTGSYTQLSFLPVESIVFSDLEAEVRGLYRSSVRGRYTNLNVLGQPTEENNSGNDLAKTLFVSPEADDFDLDTLEAELARKAPIIGIGVQPGTIHYNAIPAHRYFFHLVRHYEIDKMDSYLTDDSNTITPANRGLSTSISNIINQYVLCDGKNINDDKVDNYPAIDKKSFELNWSDTHDAVRNSIMGSTSEGKTFRTPPLFDCDQLSLRFIRGLNWLRTSDNPNTGEVLNTSIYDSSTNILNDKGCAKDKEVYFIDNDKKYLKIKANPADVANHTKNISQVGLHLASTDNALQRNWKHTHLGFGATTNGEVNLNPNVADADTLNEYRNYFAGHSKTDDYCPVKNNSTDYSAWKTYVTSWNSGTSTGGKFAGTTILPTIGGLNKKGLSISGYEYLRNYPIIKMGGSSSYWWNIDGCLRFGKRKVGKCMNHRTRTHGIAKIRDGKYTLASALSGKSWRFVTSLPEVNKYDDITSPLNKKTRVTYHESTTDGTGVREIDDNLPSPPAVNFIPLMKI